MKTYEEAIDVRNFIQKQVGDKFGIFFSNIFVVGSCIISGRGNDIDILIQVSSLPFVSELRVFLFEEGYTEQTGDKDYGHGDFFSFKKEAVNVLVVWDEQTTKLWPAAVQVCIWANADHRDDRVSIHKMIMDGTCHDEVSPRIAK